MGYEFVADSQASEGVPEHGDMAVAFDFDEGNIALGSPATRWAFDRCSRAGWRP